MEIRNTHLVRICYVFHVLRLFHVEKSVFGTWKSPKMRICFSKYVLRILIAYFRFFIAYFCLGYSRFDSVRLQAFSMRLDVDHGAAAENADEVHVPLQDDQLGEEEDADDDADDADVPAAAAGAEDASPGGVLPKLLQGPCTAPTRPRARAPGGRPLRGRAHGPTSSASRSRASAR
jgi:hypothetical protein